MLQFHEIQLNGFWAILLTKRLTEMTIFVCHGENQGGGIWPSWILICWCPYTSACLHRGHVTQFACHGGSATAVPNDSVWWSATTTLYLLSSLSNVSTTSAPTHLSPHTAPQSLSCGPLMHICMQLKGKSCRKKYACTLHANFSRSFVFRVCVKCRFCVCVCVFLCLLPSRPVHWMCICALILSTVLAERGCCVLITDPHRHCSPGGSVYATW